LNIRTAVDIIERQALVFNNENLVAMFATSLVLASRSNPIRKIQSGDSVFPVEKRCRKESPEKKNHRRHRLLAPYHIGYFIKVLQRSNQSYDRYA
jgi:hypothetical protein